jgi:phosphopantothenoylcysteine decarboxylase/phosphopantothenate--cysteine ligase
MSAAQLDLSQKIYTLSRWISLRSTLMNCIVTAGPTYEPLDDVRRLTNSSTGRLGSELASFLVASGHEVTLLLGEQATFRGKIPAAKLETFTTTADLRDRLQALSRGSIGAVFHAAAVSDFTFGKISVRSAKGEMTEVKSRKISTRQGALFAELAPTPKIIASLRDWYPDARLVGWKLELEGGRADILLLAQRQIAECRTDACVANGPAYGDGFGLVTADHASVHLPDRPALFDALEKLVRK